MLKFQIFVVFYEKMLARFYIFKRMLSKRRTQIQYVDAEHTSTNIKRMMSMRRIKKNRWFQAKLSKFILQNFKL